MNPRISYDTNQRLPIVAKVIKADLAFITGKFETLGSNFRHKTGRAAAVPSYYIPGSLLKTSKTIINNTKIMFLTFSTTKYHETSNLI